MCDTERYAYPVEGATKMVYFVHGYGDRAGRYLEFADHLNQHGIREVQEPMKMSP